MQRNKLVNSAAISGFVKFLLILTSAIFAWSIHKCDGRTDRWTQ